MRGTAVLLDVGANADCRPPHLVAFAAMGTVFARVGLGIDRAARSGCCRSARKPQGERAHPRGAPAAARHRLRFVGNVEARDLYSGAADVVVCDGFTGNVVIKVSEGVVGMVERMLGEAFAAMGGEGARLAVDAVGRFRARVDYAEYGGAPLLGVGGPAVVAHGRSSARAVMNAIRMAARFAGEGMAPRIEQELLYAAGGRLRRDCMHLSGAGVAGGRDGQGARRRLPDLRETMAEADDALGERLSALCFDGPAETAGAHGEHAAGHPRGERGRVSPARADGHQAGVRRRPSLGEYSAHVAAGTIAFADALRTVRRRGRYMQEAVPVGQGAMAAILGLDAATVAQACAEAAQGEVVSPANMNAPGPGGDRRLERRRGAGVERAKQLGARRAIPLPVSAPFHCALMRPAEARLAPELRALRVSDPAVPVVANVDAEAKRTAAESHRGAGEAGVGAGPMGGRDATACIGRRPQVC